MVQEGFLTTVLYFFKVVTKHHRRGLSKGVVWVAANKVSVHNPLSNQIQVPHKVDKLITFSIY